MKKRFYPQSLILFSLLLFLAPVLPASVEAKNSVLPGSGETLRAIYDLFEKSPDLMPGKRGKTQRLIAEEVREFYLDRNFRPVWSDSDTPLRIARDMVDAVKDAYKEGLNPDSPDYHLKTILRLMKKIEAKDAHTPKRAAQLDVLLTEAFFTLGAHLRYGMTLGMKLVQKNGARSHKTGMGKTLQEALKKGSIKKSLFALSPKHPGYLRLKKTLAAYEKIRKKGGWNIDKERYLVAERPYRRAEGSIKIKKISMEDFKILRSREDTAQNEVRNRLMMTGDLKESATDDPLALKKAVIRFQKRHHITPDGNVGRTTAAMMAVAVEQQMHKIRLNMERWRWQPRQMHKRYVMVNVPGFTLTLADTNKTVLTLQTIVGKQKHKTPIFNAEMTYLVFNPYWRVPERIFKEDIMPKVREDISYLEAANIKLFALWDTNEDFPIDPAEINWYDWQDGDEKKYRFRQGSGSGNSLGRVKFMFPNPYHVYIHDTPSKGLFYNRSGLLSSGCIRLKEPMKLARELLKEEQSDITPKELSRILSKKQPRTVVLKKPLPVHITYQTAWVDEDGTVHFHDDIYAFDEELMRHLDKKLKH